jgi:hypothetical protein
MRIIVVNSHFIRKSKHTPGEDQNCSTAWHLGMISVARRERVNLEVSIVPLTLDANQSVTKISLRKWMANGREWCDSN